MNAITTVQFDNTNLEIIDRNGQQWLQSSQIAKALGYARVDSVARIFDRNKDEFTTAMSCTVNLTVKGFGSGESEKDVRIFSPRGAHLIAMFARTDKAKAFRKWVLDVLDITSHNLVIESNKLTPAQQRGIQEAVNKTGVWRDVYSAIKTTYRVGTYKDLLASQFDEVINFISNWSSKAINHVEVSKPILSNRRFILSYNHEGKETITPVDDNAVVMTMPQVLKYINEPNGMPVSTSDLAEFAKASINALQRRSDFYQKRCMKRNKRAT